MKWLGALKSQLWLIRGCAGLVGARKMPRAAMAIFNGILLPPPPPPMVPGFKGAARPLGKSLKRGSQRFFCPGPQQLWRLPFEAQQRQSKPQMMLPCPDTGGGSGSVHHLLPPSAHVSGERGSLCPCHKAKSHRNGSYCNYSLPEHMVSRIFRRVKCMNMHHN